MSPYYQVGDQIFLNRFLALRESATKNVPIHFNLYDSAFDSVSWDEPTLSWNELLDIRAHQIASKNKPIVLNFSGGTDSYTIYEVFRRNNIHIDVVRLFNKKDNIQELTVPPALAWLRANHDPRTKIVVVDHYIKELQDLYSSPDWYLGRSQRLSFGLSLSDLSYVFDQDPTLHHLSDHCNVNGYDKPRLMFKNGAFYSYQEDTQYSNSLGAALIENFFISPELPELHVKQSYMLARYIQNSATTKQKPLEFFNDIHASFGAAYYDYAIQGCGRFGDFGNSSVQKESQRTSSLIIGNQINQIQCSGRVDVALTEGLRTNESYALNYIKGLNNLRNDPVMKQFFRHDQNVFSLVDLRSKMYKLNFSVT